MLLLKYGRRPFQREIQVDSPFYGERFTQRLEAFSDLVFGFSLSLLATRLDVPANASRSF